MTEPTLNERAAKCMGWNYAPPPRDVCLCGPIIRDPHKLLDDARLVEAKAIEQHGWDAYIAALSSLFWHEPNPRAEDHARIEQEIITATAEQRCLAAVRLMEKRR